MRHVYSPIALVAIATAFIGCYSPPVEAPKTQVEEQKNASSAQTKKDKVDLLFLVDDSGSMKPKQDALRTRFPDLIKKLNEIGKDKPVSYHIGVVTSDIGASGVACGQHRGGTLQPVGAAGAGCLGPVGKPFIDYDQRTGADNLGGRTLEDVFSCMAAVGTDGCGFEMQLESVYQLLHNPSPTDKDFLRADAILAVVFLTDEDDCSAPADTKLFTTPTLGPQNSYLCTQYGITCDGLFPLPSTPSASYTSCAPATTAQGTKLVGLEKYINYFKLPRAQGGVKADPRDVILATISAPTTPFFTELGTGTTVCGAGIMSCTTLGHSCTLVGAGPPPFVGDPATRLEAVVTSVEHHQITSICAQDYKGALESLSDLIHVVLAPTCLDAPIADLAHPDCVVEDVDAELHRTSIARCDDALGNKPCWHTINIPTCAPAICNPISHSYQQVGVEILRVSAPPDGTVAEVSCATIAIAGESPDSECPGSPPDVAPVLPVDM